MYCVKCGMPIQDDALFCSYCGSKQGAKTCIHKLSPFLNRYKYLFYIYIIWFSINTFLLCVGHGNKFSTYFFFPFHYIKLSGGERFYLDLPEQIEYYDKFDYVIYTLVIPLLLCTVLKACIEAFKHLYCLRNR